MRQGSACVEDTTLRLEVASCMSWCQDSGVGSWRCARRSCELAVHRFCRHEIFDGVAGRRSSPVTVAMPILSRKASDISVALVKKRCAWNLRVKLKPHCELLHAEGEDLMEVMSLDRGAGVRPLGVVSVASNASASCWRERNRDSSDCH